MCSSGRSPSGSEATKSMMKSDGEASVKTVRDAVGRRQVEECSLEPPAKGERFSNDTLEESEQQWRECVQVGWNPLKEKTRYELTAASLITFVADHASSKVHGPHGWGMHPTQAKYLLARQKERFALLHCNSLTTIRSEVQWEVYQHSKTSSQANSPHVTRR